MKLIWLGALMLGACGTNSDRLTDEQATAAHNVAGENLLAVDEPPPPPAPAAPASVTYKAVGTEPGWALTVRGGSMDYVGDYGEVEISQPTPADFRARPGRYAGTRLKLTITPGPCSDGMSDLVYRQTVRLVADGKTVDGCGGGTMAPDGLAGTSWSVTAINGRATPGGPNYFLNFAASTIAAKFGCNSISGGFRLNGDHLWATDLIQTEMACPEPAMSFERLGGAVLNSNMRIEPLGGEAMRLVSEAGSIDLKRSI